MQGEDAVDWNIRLNFLDCLNNGHLRSFLDDLSDYLIDFLLCFINNARSIDSKILNAFD